jgi:hypothetical protein
MELFFFDAGLVSVWAGRETAGDWGVRAASGTVEMWVGKTYVCTSFDERETKRAARIIAVALVTFTIGWFIDPPRLAANSGVAAVHHMQTEEACP